MMFRRFSINGNICVSEHVNLTPVHFPQKFQQNLFYFDKYSSIMLKCSTYEVVEDKYEETAAKATDRNHK